MRIVLFGCGAKATVVLQKLLDLKEDVVGMIHADVDKHEVVTYQQPWQLALENDITLYTREDNLVSLFKDINPDAIFVVGWRYKIPKEQYSIPQKGTIVFHDSLLPKYRGFAPMNWAIINGEIKTGVTMFYIADEVDSGDIIGKAEIPITEYDYAKDVETKITQSYLGLLTAYLPLIILDKVKATSQDHTQATYTCKRIPADGLIDWSKTSMQVYNLIRGLTEPYPGAFTYLHDNKSPRKMFIWKASLDTEYKQYVGRVPGRVADIIKGKGVRVLTGFGSLIIERVGFEFGSTERDLQADEVIKSIKTTLSGLDK